MTPPYRCPWCPLEYANTPRFITHIGSFHAAKLFQLLRKVGYKDIGSFGTRKTLDPPRNALNPCPPLNPGVSGEGDS